MKEARVLTFLVTYGKIINKAMVERKENVMGAYMVAHMV